MELLIYLLKVSACTTLFFAFYLLVLKHLTFFKINRFYLLSTLLLSFLIPALQINIERQVEPVLVETPVLQANPHQLESVKMNDLVVAPMPIAKENFDWVSLLPLIYGLIAGALLLVCAWQLHQLIRQTKKTSDNFNGLKLISKSTGFTNCSFFNYVFINESILTETELMVLLQHEQIHATQYHSIDKLILMLFKAVLWFNPIVYLYDKALEQTHEYEADEATSQHFGNQPYAQLLLKLAIAKSETPLIHNFVKSPVKERIKMLFNPKSNHMKKLSYLFVLPISICLVWFFAVEVVYAQTMRGDQQEIKILPEKDESINGKILSIKQIAVGYAIELSSENKIYFIEANDFHDKIKVGNDVIVYLSGSINNFTRKDKDGKIISVLDKPVYMLSKITMPNGKLIYERKSERYAFAYEVNKVRFAVSEIKSIERNAGGKINKIILNDGVFTINLNLSAQNFQDNHFKSGDKVTVKFIGEKLVSKNAYTTNKMVVLYSEPRKYELKNEALYNRFYNENGSQKVVGLKNENLKPSRLNNSKDKADLKIIYSSGLTGNIKSKITYLEDAVITISGSNLKAKHVELDGMQNILTATHAIISNGGSMIVADKAVFDLTNGTYRTYESNSENDKQSKKSFWDYDLREKQDMIAKSIRYTADSVKISADKNTITVMGKAKMSFKSITIDADEISYNKFTKEGVAKNLLLTNSSGMKIKGSKAKFKVDDKAGVEIWQNEKENLVVDL